MEFELIFNRIKNYHEELGHNVVDGYMEQRMQSMRNSALALVIELAELINSTPWKPWRKIKDQIFDKDNAIREIVDIIFFLVSICEELHITPQEIEEKFLQVLENNYTRLNNGYSKKGGEENNEELWDADPNCIHNIVDAPGGGVKCTKCKGWMCL